MQMISQGSDIPL